MWLSNESCPNTSTTVCWFSTAMSLGKVTRIQITRILKDSLHLHSHSWCIDVLAISFLPSVSPAGIHTSPFLHCCVSNSCMEWTDPTSGETRYLGMIPTVYSLPWKHCVWWVESFTLVCIRCILGEKVVATARLLSQGNAIMSGMLILKM